MYRVIWEKADGEQGNTVWFSDEFLCINDFNHWFFTLKDQLNWKVRE